MRVFQPYFNGSLTAFADTVVTYGAAANVDVLYDVVYVHSDLKKLSVSFHYN